MLDEIKVYSAITPARQRNVLFKGSLIASLGLFLLVIGGIYLPLSLLQYIGFPVLALAFALIYLGLMPYRRLMKLEKNPDQLIATNKGYLQYCRGNERIITIPFSNIQQLIYVEKDNEYGAGIWLKDQKNVVLHNEGDLLLKKQKSSKEIFGCDLFLPFFTRRSLTRLGFITLPHEIDED
jgi:hypothetical protein